MSIFPRKYHGPELKCGGPSMCRDCADRVKNGIGFEEWSDGRLQDSDTIFKSENKETEKCECTPRVLFWKGCVCKKSK